MLPKKPLIKLLGLFPLKLIDDLNRTPEFFPADDQHCDVTVAVIKTYQNCVGLFHRTHLIKSKTV